MFFSGQTPRHKNGRHTTRQHPLACAIHLAVMSMAFSLPAASLLHPVAAHAQNTQAKQHYRIAAGPLGATLSEFAATAGVTLSTDAEQTRGLQSPGLNGNYSVSEGFTSLLGNHGLQAIPQENGSYVLRRLPPADATTLPAVSVTSNIHRATSEGSGSYAARAVTIGKTTQTLREIPQSVSVVTRQQMNDQNLTTIADALQTVTGIRTDSYESRERAFTRGYPMGIQFDGVPQQSPSIHTDLALFDRVEILRGPNGLLQGTSEPGGSINYVRKRPLDKLAISGSVSAGSWNNYRIEGDISAPFNETGTLRGRAVSVYQDKNAFYDVGESQTRIGYAIVEFDATPDTTLSLSYTQTKRDNINFWGLPTYTDGTLVSSRSAFVGSNRTSVTKLDDITLDATHHFGSGWEGKFVINRKKEDYRGYGAFGSTGINKATGLGNLSVGHVQGNSQWDSFDLNVSGPISLFDRQHSLAFGYNKARYDYISGSRYTAFPNWDVLNNHDFGSTLQSTVASKSQSLTEQSGLYGVARLKLADPLTLILGGRWSDYSTKNRSYEPTIGAWTIGNAKADGEFTPYGGLIWDINNQLSWYASYVDTFIPQTTRDYLGNMLDPRVGWQAETGIKGEFFDGQLNASLAYFRIRDKNRSMDDPDPTHVCATNSGRCSMAAGVIQSDGWEAEVSGSPMAGLDLVASYTRTIAKFVNDNNPANIGQRFETQTTPKHLLKLWGNYRFNNQILDGALVGWNMGAGVQIQSELHTATVHQGGYAIASASLGYRINQNWNTQLSINNLFDRTYLQSVGSTTFYNIYGTPRNATLTLRGNF